MRILEAVGLTKRFAGLTALDTVSFSMRPGEILGLFGPKGAGKTTCCDCLSGFAAPDEGRVVFDGRDVSREPPHRLARLGIARTFQIVRPFKALIAAENVAVALDHRHSAGLRGMVASWRKADVRSRSRTLLERVGLAGVADRPAGLLPLGMLKRLELARALALEPRLLVLDEPLGDLAAEEMVTIVRLISGLREEGLTILLVQHQMGVAMALVDRAVVLDHGVLIAEGTPDTVRADRRVIEAYLGENAVAQGH